MVEAFATTRELSPPPCQPVDLYTRHRLHWIKGNGFEVWDWIGNGRTWTRLGASLRFFTPERAAKEGWRYIGEAHPPFNADLPSISRDTLLKARERLEGELERVEAELLSRGVTR